MRRKALKWFVLISVAACLSSIARSAPQQGKPATTSETPQARPDFRVEYTVRELEGGKLLNSRSYKVRTQLGDPARIRVGSRVPFTTSYAVGSSASGAANIQYQDVGINIDCRVREERDNGVLLNTVFESMNLGQETRNMGSGVANPVFRQVRAEGISVVPLGKPTVIDVVDDVASNHQYEIEVTVTKVK